MPKYLALLERKSDCLCLPTRIFEAANGEAAVDQLKRGWSALLLGAALKSTVTGIYEIGRVHLLEITGAKLGSGSDWLWDEEQMAQDRIEFDRLKQKYGW